eukprot:CAMPEP_0198678220 /NCGR_PEP_ID=MMETSP1468-20131203/357_1 /TAXON_ID=1461545 /ORGANISM="Mantoniella sp, Strain CCMP1436" /LENGTH=304 /DNA_ID=CAMNT_0044415293 /DNA_START=28 /DNA_END=942 /DNA_ORIENTATION=-
MHALSALRGAVRRAVVQRPPSGCRAAYRGFASGDDATVIDTAGMPLSPEELQSHLMDSIQSSASTDLQLPDKSARANMWARILRSGTPLRQDPWPHPSGAATFWLLRHADAPTYTNVAAGDVDPFDPAEQMGGEGSNATVIAVLVQQTDPFHVLYGASIHPALPTTAATSLVQAAAATIAPERCEALVSLPGLCAWVRDGERWNDAGMLAACGEESAAAARAVALNQPRPGHSVLGPGTFNAAKTAWMFLANQYVDSNDELLEEMMMYKTVLGAGTWNIQHLADTDPEYMVLAGGATAIFEPKP